MRLLLLFVLIILLSEAVDRNRFKKCSQSEFCKRQRSFTKDKLQYSILTNTFSFEGSRLKATILDSKTNTLYNLEIIRLQDNIVRVRINEDSPLFPRYEVKDVLTDSVREEKFTKFDNQNYELVLDETRKIVIDPLNVRIDYIMDQQLVFSVNHRNLFYFEYQRERPAPPPPPPPPPTEIPADTISEDPLTFTSAQAPDNEPLTPPPTGHKRHIDIGIDTSDAWSSSFGGTTDTHPHGPQSVGIDITFFETGHVYGIPEHASSFALKSTDGAGEGYGEPYRLYNLDVFEYEVNEPMALYGAVPFMMSHSDKNISSAVFWMNAAETWIDIKHQINDQQPSKSVETRWMSESGIIDLFLLVGKTPKDIFAQFGSLVGTQEMPPLFATAYHQCRWNYINEADVQDVHQHFEDLDIPYDVIWLDIEHTDGKRYFTWDSKHFPNPSNMISSIAKFGRKMVTIVDPHIKRDDNYEVHKDAHEKNMYVKDGTQDYDGFCWPGSSSWIDYLDPKARDWWASRFSYDLYKGSTPDLYTWNDMNEPSVFNGPEVTMKKTALHHEGWEHRDVHNIYGMLMHRATATGLAVRNLPSNKRPFVLSRAFYAGSQRWGAIWTGDNAAQWSHLAIAQPMLLSLGVAGISFSGADVGGFFGNPEPELLVRWYQAAVYQPFFRAHAHHDTKRREPWVHGDPWVGLIKSAIITRYQILPYLYTSFYEAYTSNTPPMRALWVEFPRDSNTYPVDDTFLLGPALLIKPITSQGQKNIDVYLPSDVETTVWYDVYTFRRFVGGQRITVETPLEKIPVFQRGGTVVPKKLRARRSSALMANDPFSLFVALDATGTKAEGELYVDDGDSFDYKQGDYVHTKFSYHAKAGEGSKFVLSASRIGGTGKFANAIEKIYILGAHRRPNSVFVQDSNDKLQPIPFAHSDDADGILILKKPVNDFSQNWVIEIVF